MKTALILCATLWLAFTSSAQNLVADYRFENNLNSSVGAAQPLAFLGNSYFTNDVVDGLASTVVHFPAGDGVTLTNANNVLPTKYTVVILFRFAEVYSWKRMIDFKNRTTDWGLYSYYGNLNFYNITTGIGGSIKAGAYLQVVLTRDAAAGVAGYVNGNPEISFTDSSGQAVLSTENMLNFFRDDLAVPNEHTSGEVARIRIYDDAMSPSAVAALDRLPGVVGVQRPVIISGLVAYASAGLPFSYQILAQNQPESYSATALPTWASLNNITGEITGTPPGVGTNVVQISANNAAGSDSRSLTIMVNQFALSLGRSGANAALTVQGPIGRHYQIEYVERLTSPNQWQTLSDFVSTAQTTTVLESAGSGQRFYRAALWP